MADVLFLTPVMPAASGNGLAMRAGLFLEGLARAGSVEVLVVPVFGGASAPGQLVDRLAASVGVLALDDAPDAVADLTARLADPRQRARAEALHPRPELCRQATLIAANEVALHAHDVSIVHVLRTYLAPFLDALLDVSGRPVLTLDVDDVESTAQLELGAADESARYTELESNYLPLLDHVVTCSRADAEDLAGRYGLTAVTPIPNAVRVPPTIAPPRRDHDLVFVANLGYEPNVEAARWLCECVLPRLPGVTVALVGSRPTAAVAALARDPRVSLAADVPDVAPWYAGARVAVVPVQRGGGTRIKVLEAFAHRRPVVSTTVGVRGLDLGDDGPVVLADTSKAFARACRDLLDDSSVATDRAASGEGLVRATAAIGVVAPAIERLVRSIVPA